MWRLFCYTYSMESRFTNPTPLESLWDIELGGQPLRAYAWEAVVPLGVMLILQFMFRGANASPRMAYAIYGVFLIALPFVVMHQTHWGLRQQMIFGGIVGVLYGLLEGLLRFIATPDFAIFFQLIIQPVLLGASGVLLAGFLFIFAFPIIKKLKRRARITRHAYDNKPTNWKRYR